MQVGKLCFELYVIMGGARNIPGSARTGAGGVDSLMHGGYNSRVLPHAQIVIAAPDFDVGSGVLAKIFCIRKTSASAADIRVQEDGTVQLTTGSTDVGQGADTVLSMIAAEVLGAPVTTAAPTDGGATGEGSSSRVQLAEQARALEAPPMVRMICWAVRSAWRSQC